MIIQTQLEVTRIAHPELPPVYLAPFDERELAAVIPIDPKSAPYERESTVRALTTATPEVIAQIAMSVRSAQTFGVYNGEIAPHCYAGIVELAASPTPDKIKGQQAYTRKTQSLGVHIYRMEQRGLGTAALLGGMSYAMLVDRTTAFDAWTSEKNGPMRHILTKLGFAETDERLNVRHYYHRRSKFSRWLFAVPEAIESGSTPPGLSERLTEGHKKFTALAMESYGIQIV